MKPEDPGESWERYVLLKRNNARKSERYHIDVGKLMDYVGVTRLHMDAVPAKLRYKIGENIRRGFTNVRQGNQWLLTQAVITACPFDRLHIGYICRDHMEFYVPFVNKKQAQEFMGSFRALNGLTGKVGGNNLDMASRDRWGRPLANWLRVSGQSRYSGKDDDGPAFAEVKHYVTGYLDQFEPRRRAVMEWFNAAKAITIPFKWE